jgi:1,2-diacylglycerol 3-alpha-glucosyltransferase
MKISILVSVLAPYAVARFRALRSLDLFDFEVLALGRSEDIREWKFPDEGINFPYVEVVPGRCVDDIAPRKLRQALIAYLKARDPAVVVTGYGDRAQRAGLKWAIRRKKIVLLISASTVLDKPRFWALERVKSLLVSRCDAAFVAGERAAHYLSMLNMPAHRIWRRMDVVDNEKFSRSVQHARVREVEIRDRYGLPPRYFLYVGRFAPEKNLLRLLEAYKGYRHVHRDGAWGLVLVGNGPERQALETFAKANHLPDIVWAGFRQIGELPELYALAGCLVLASLSEPWGLVVNEAMASGLPVLVSERCGCVPDLVHQGLNGSVFDPTDSDELSRLMALMASERMDLKTMGQESRRLISLYSPEAWALSLADCIKQTAARKGILVS